MLASSYADIFNTGGSGSITVAAVPEPATAALGLVMAIPILFGRRRLQRGI